MNKILFTDFKKKLLMQYEVTHIGIGYLGTELNLTVFFYVQSSVKYRSWPDMHSSLLSDLPQMYPWDRVEDYIPYGFLATEINATGE